MKQEENQFEHIRIVADSKQNPLRVDKFILNFVENATRNKIQKAIRTGNVLVNDQPIKSNYKVKPKDIVKIVYDFPKEVHEVLPQKIPLDIIYEDEDILLVNKKAGMVVHPGFGNREGTLVNALSYHFDNLPNMGEEDRPGLVHRLDKNTSGILVVAKTEKSMEILSKKFRDRDLDRKYIALVWGDLKENNGTISGNIGRSLKNRKIMDVYPDG
ncbi:MAG: RNA pseudouridine synthase, partial [Flavobacteriales bacterium]|nr:RNA pseudouridine synthase [Flavobacteriales bacterium]